VVAAAVGAVGTHAHAAEPVATARPRQVPRQVRHLELLHHHRTHVVSHGFEHRLRGRSRLCHRPSAERGGDLLLLLLLLGNRLARMLGFWFDPGFLAAGALLYPPGRGLVGEMVASDSGSRGARETEAVCVQADAVAKRTMWRSSAPLIHSYTGK
jgi:hypothetical protein